jgi:hypothetical protein
MARRADPEHIHQARRIAVRNGLTDYGMPLEDAEQWCAAWEHEAVGRPYREEDRARRLFSLGAAIRLVDATDARTAIRARGHRGDAITCNTEMLRDAWRVRSPGHEAMALTVPRGRRPARARSRPVPSG